MTNNEIQALRKMYPNGTRIKMVFMDDPDPIRRGELGTVEYVDDVGTLLVRWDNGRTLGLIPEVDRFVRVH